MISLTFGSQSYTVIRLNELTDQNETDNLKRLSKDGQQKLLQFMKKI